jgi:D-serine dehydratase
MPDWLDPLIDASFKGWPHGSPPLRRSQVAAQSWNVMDGDLPLPVAVLHRAALAHNIAWMQRFAVGAGIGLAPHGKTTMSPQILRLQLEAGAWGLTFANVSQMEAGLVAGARNVLIANQVLAPADLAAIAARLESDPGLRVLFLLDSAAQLELIESTSPARPFEVLLEIGLRGGRTGVRGHDEAMALARRAATSRAVTLAGLESFEGLAANGDDGADRALVEALFDRMDGVARACDAEGLFGNATVLVSAGGSALFDLVAQRLRPALGRPVQGLLRSGCYVTHDQGHYRRLVRAVDRRLGCAEGAGLRAALEVWTLVQALPEDGLAILAGGKRDMSFDLGMPVPLAVVPRATRQRVPAPAAWHIAALNDQHAYLRLEAEPGGPGVPGEPGEPGEPGPARAPSLAVGDRVVLGISHPCTTFDKWRWMPVVEDDGRVVDAITTLF